MPSIVIIGASADKAKFGNKAVRAFKMKGYTVYPVNPNGGEIEGLRVYKSILEIPEQIFDMVSLYLPPSIGMKAIEEIAQKKVEEVWLNPGAESPELVEKGESLGLTMIEACSIVGIGVNPSSL